MLGAKLIDSDHVSMIWIGLNVFAPPCCALDVAINVDIGPVATMSYEEVHVANRITINWDRSIDRHAGIG